MTNNDYLFYRQCDCDKSAMCRGLRPLCLAVLLIFTVSCRSLTTASSAANDDFGFEVGEEQDLVVEITEPPTPPAKLHGIPDITANVGKLLSFQVPDDAFQGNVVKLEVRIKMR